MVEILKDICLFNRFNIDIHKWAVGKIYSKSNKQSDAYDKYCALKNAQKSAANRIHRAYARDIIDAFKQLG